MRSRARCAAPWALDADCRARVRACVRCGCRGYNIGVRIIDEFLAKANLDGNGLSGACRDFRETADVIAKVCPLLRARCMALSLACLLTSPPRAADRWRSACFWASQPTVRFVRVACAHGRAADRASSRSGELGRGRQVLQPRLQGCARRRLLPATDACAAACGERGGSDGQPAVARSGNPLATFVELPPTCANLQYSNILCGVIRGALHMVRTSQPHGLLRAHSHAPAPRRSTWW